VGKPASLLLEGLLEGLSSLFGSGTGTKVPLLLLLLLWRWL